MLTVWAVNYNSADLLSRCVASLPAEVDRIVVRDNASPAPGEHERLRRLARSDNRVVVHAGTANIGFGAAMNRIADVEGSSPDDVVWLLNPDTQLRSPSVRSLLGALDAGTDIVSPLILSGAQDEPVVWFTGGDVDVRRGLVRHWDYGAQPAAGGQDLRRTSFMTGAAPMLHRRVWDLLGGFREDLFLYWEDVDLALRAEELGLRLAVHRGTILFHLEAGSSRSGTALGTTSYYYQSRNRMIVSAERAGRWDVLLGRGAPVTSRILVRPLVREREQRTAKARAALRGTLDGLRLAGARRRAADVTRRRFPIDEEPRPL